FWADDGNLYAFNCDGRGFGTAGRNMSFNKLVGPDAQHLEGRNVNSMDEYGGGGQKEADGATWKADGQECIDGVFYAFVSRNTYGSDSKDPLVRQTAVNSSLIKSTDRGKTWTRTARENYTDPMWPGRFFGTPYFIHYGMNGGQVRQDGADRYVYATSNDGFWNDGDKYVLARVLRTKLPLLNAADWTYYTGGSGQNSSNWSRDLTKAAPILNLPAQCGSGPACYIPALGSYLMVAWYNPVALTHWFEPTEMKYDFYGAPHPWGPWTLIKSVSDKILTGGHMYGPSLCAKFQMHDGPDVRMSLFTSGCPFDDQPSSVYKMWEIPIILKTKPEPRSTLVNDSDPRITYTGTWRYDDKRPFFDYGDDAHVSQVAGSSAEFSFKGTGIDYIAEKNADHGPVDVFLDGKFQRTVDLHLVNFPRVSRVVLFSARGLGKGAHTIKIVNKSNDWAVVDAFSVFGQ
ncbi:MAG: DUF4185 domain-containing protein, partial [Armatimonadota bacterium]|nr:DUF4185 domain-containing protein [Armatimonadota bacterium]